MRSNIYGQTFRHILWVKCVAVESEKFDVVDKICYTLCLMSKLTFIDLFAGIGGMRIPFENLGGTCVFSSEWDKHARQTYVYNFDETPAGDITQINESDIPNHDILLAGFPCQPFSIM